MGQSLVDDLDECWLIVIRGLEAMKVHDGRRNISEAGVWEVRPEPDPRGKPRSSYGDWNLHRVSGSQSRPHRQAGTYIWINASRDVCRALTGFSVCELRVWTFPSLSRSGFPDLSLFAMSSALPWSAVSAKMPPTCSIASRMIYNRIAITMESQ